ncbi:unnamed protein product [Heligmosomoides polygyrus]|uniref:Uncharacterized protein n=1 Tax=Heligmosomoides polygyrus TaxID=6339 RepID=A0A183FF08_HELPZ|nr:unnamed protein product [Heligmosomoides polygyrus]
MLRTGRTPNLKIYQLAPVSNPIFSRKHPRRACVFVKPSNNQRTGFFHGCRVESAYLYWVLLTNALWNACDVTYRDIDAPNRF